MQVAAILSKNVGFGIYALALGSLGAQAQDWSILSVCFWGVLLLDAVFREIQEQLDAALTKPTLRRNQHCTRPKAPRTTNGSPWRAPLVVVALGYP